MTNKAGRAGNTLVALVVAKGIYDNPAALMEFGPDLLLHVFNATVSPESSIYIKVAATGADLWRACSIADALTKGNLTPATQRILMVDLPIHLASFVQNVKNTFDSADSSTEGRVKRA